MKKIIGVILSVTMLLVMCLPVPAAENPTSGQTDIYFKYVPAVPLYTVTIPGSFELSSGENKMPVEFTGNESLSGQFIVITFEGGSYSYVEPDFYGKGEDGILHEIGLYYSDDIDRHRIYYNLRDFNGALVWNSMHTSTYYLDAGIELGSIKATIDKDIAYLTIEVKDEFAVSNQPAGEYTSNITFGISLR